MTPGVTKFLPNPGRAAAGAPIRENIFTHYFVGGNGKLHVVFVCHRKEPGFHFCFSDTYILYNSTIL